MNKKHALTYLVIITGLILIALILTPKTIEYTANKADASEVSEPLTGNNRLVQDITLSQRFNKLGIEIATYRKEIQGDSSLTISLKYGGSTVATKKFSSGELGDNKTLWLENIVGHAGTYKLSVETNDVDENSPIAVYLADKDNAVLNDNRMLNGMAYQTVLTKKQYSINYIVLTLFILVVLVAVRCKYSRYKRCTKAVVVIMCAITTLSIISLAITAYITTGHMNPDALCRLWAFDEMEHNIKNVVVDIEQQQNNAEITYIDRPDGTAITAFQSVMIDNLNDSILLIKLIPRTDAPKKYYDTGLFALQKGHWKNAGAMEYVYSGQKSIQQYINIAYTEQLRLDFSDTTSFEDLHKINRLNHLSKIVINDTKDISNTQNESIRVYLTVFFLCMTVGIFVVGAIQYWHISECYAQWAEKNKITERKRFLLFGTIFGLVFLLLLPIYQAPDEGAHLKFILNDLGYVGEEKYFLDSLDGYVGANRLSEQSGEKLELSLYYKAMEQEMSTPLKRVSMPSIGMLRHAPQALGIQIGIWANLPPIWVFVLGRLFSLIFYLALGVQSLKIVPYKKELLLFCLISPVSMQMASSLSYDAVLIPISFYLISYILCLRQSRKLIGAKQFLIIGALVALIALIKINYILLVLLMLLLPKSQYRFKRILTNLKLLKNKIVQVACIVLLLGFMLAVLYGVNYGRIIYAMMLKPVQSVMLLLITLHQKGGFYLQSMFGNFGWLDTRASNGFIFFIVMIMLLSAIEYNDDEPQFLQGNAFVQNKDKVVVFTSWLMCSLLCFVAMIQWSLRIQFVELGSSIKEITSQIPLIGAIEGVQGRYFLPMLPLPLLLLKSQKFATKSKIELWLNLGYIVMILYTATLLVSRYWK